MDTIRWKIWGDDWGGKKIGIPLGMQKFEPNVLFEDNHLIVINKPAGMLVQGDRTGDIPLVEYIKAYIKDKYNKPGKVFLGIPHRIDRPTSGILVFARTSKALERMNRLFKEREVEKTYWAVVKNCPKKKEGQLENFLFKNQQKNKSYALREEKKGTKKAILSYKWLGQSDHYHLLEVYPQTGRHHQIRVQLAAIGSPIKGDLKYGAPRSNKDASIHLHARKIKFIHPVQKEPLEIVAPPPMHDAVWRFFANI